MLLLLLYYHYSIVILLQNRNMNCNKDISKEKNEGIPPFAITPVANIVANMKTMKQGTLTQMHGYPDTDTDDDFVPSTKKTKTKTKASYWRSSHDHRFRASTLRLPNLKDQWCLHLLRYCTQLLHSG